jgi:hypothetical protein
MTQNSDAVERRRDEINRHADKWYIHINNGSGYTEIRNGDRKTTTYHGSNKKVIVEG